MGCVVVKVTLGRGFLTVLRFFPVTVIASVFDTQISLMASLNKTLHRNTFWEINVMCLEGLSHQHKRTLSTREEASLTGN